MSNIAVLYPHVAPAIIAGLILSGIALRSLAGLLGRALCSPRPVADHPSAGG
jgi:hypothetical protein